MSAIEFQIPKKVSIDKGDAFTGTFSFSPLEKGYGVTIGNSLRRVLFSSLEGYAITSIRVPGVQHEFSTIEGIVEDAVELVLNLKQVRFKKVGEGEVDKISISIKKQATFKAGDIAKFTPNLEILNPDFIICHLDSAVNLELEITVEKGRGYIPAEDNKPANAVLGLVPIDSIFTPIKNVSYKVENTRVEQNTDYEKLIFTIETDGSIEPEKALECAADLMIKHFMLFTNSNMVQEASQGDVVEVLDEDVMRVYKLLKTPLADLGLSVRAFNCLKTAGIKTLGDLARLEVAEMSKFRNFGKRSQEELEELMENKGLCFGMDVSKYKLDEM